MSLDPVDLLRGLVLISSLSLIGYVATRALGTDRGVILTALSGGLVSSTAVTLSFARTSKTDHANAMSSILAAGILLRPTHFRPVWFASALLPPFQSAFSPVPIRKPLPE